MPGETTRAQHDALMTQMAETLGVDLDGATMRGDVPPEARAGMVTACMGCADPGACAHWLARTPSAKAAPSWCRNGDLLARLATE